MKKNTKRNRKCRKSLEKIGKTKTKTIGIEANHKRNEGKIKKTGNEENHKINSEKTKRNRK